MGNACAANPQGNIYDDDDEVEEISASNRANSLNADLARLKREQNEVLRGNNLLALLTWTASVAQRSDVIPGSSQSANLQNYIEGKGRNSVQLHAIIAPVRVAAAWPDACPLLTVLSRVVGPTPDVAATGRQRRRQPSQRIRSPSAHSGDVAQSNMRAHTIITTQLCQRSSQLACCAVLHVVLS